MAKQNAPALGKRESVGCLLGGDIDVHSTESIRTQFLARFGLSSFRAALVGPLIFGEVQP